MRIFFIISLISSFLFSQKIYFNESKYIYALDNSFSKSGILDIDKNKIRLHYKNSDKKIIYTDTNIQIVTEDEIETFAHEESFEYTLFFQLVLAVYTNDTTSLLDNFTIEKKEKITTLLPSEFLASIIKNIQYEKTQNKLKYLKINFLNLDRITIEESK